MDGITAGTHVIWEVFNEWVGNVITGSLVCWHGASVSRGSVFILKPFMPFMCKSIALPYMECHGVACLCSSLTAE